MEIRDIVSFHRLVTLCLFIMYLNFEQLLIHIKQLLKTYKKSLLVRRGGKREPSNSWKNVMTSQSNKFTIFAA